MRWSEKIKAIDEAVYKAMETEMDKGFQEDEEASKWRSKNKKLKKLK